MVAVSTDPLFFYISYLRHPYYDEKNELHPGYCLGIQRRLKIKVLVCRSLTDLSFIVHIIWEIRRAKKTVASMFKPEVNKGGRLKILDWFEHPKAIAKELTWSSFLTDFLAVLPIPHVFVLVLFHSPHYNFSENKMTLNGLLLAQYLPRMYRIFLSFREFRKHSRMWLKAAFYFFMYLIASHVIGAFWYFNTIQAEARCWYVRLKEQKEIRPFRCDVDPPLDDSTQIMISEYCPINPVNASIYDFGSFSDTLSSGYTQKFRFRDKLFYFAWWGLKNLSNYGTNIVNSRFIWENCFAMLVSGIGLVLFAVLIGNMQECFQSAEERKVISDKVRLKEKELQVWMNNDLIAETLGRDTENTRTEMIRNIRKRMTDNKDAHLENVFSLIPWNSNSMKSLKRTLCMSMLTKVPLFTNMDEKVVTLICDYLNPVTYNEKTFAYRMEEPLDSMLLVVEGIMVIYGTSTATATATSTHGAITGTSSTTIHGSLEKGSVYGHNELLSWASPGMPVTYATLPICKSYVKCLSQVEGFVLSAQDLRTVVSMNELCWNHQGTESGGGEAESAFYIERSLVDQ